MALPRTCTAVSFRTRALTLAGGPGARVVSQPPSAVVLLAEDAASCKTAVYLDGWLF